MVSALHVHVPENLGLPALLGHDSLHLDHLVSCPDPGVV
jgi:hypothetical protein